MAEPMHRFIVERLRELAPAGARVLDFGSGDGALVAELRGGGFDAVGSDVSVEGMTAKPGPDVHMMIDSRLPFENASFDAICANQVFEHVADLTLALTEISRVLRPGGVFLNIFPSIGVIREGHCGVAMAHWLQSWPSLQRVYLQAAFMLGFGFFRDGRTCAEWAAHMGDYLQRFTVYRRERDLMRSHHTMFQTVARQEETLAAFRLSPRLGWLVSVMLRPLTRLAVRRLGGMVIIARTA
ncbi:class I SAM-dependent methyltransferase [Allopontixanthobacter sediminis]|uniref:Methyltransferase domain-containing protein n=1 Tax=Allopontixanthobacter sediminis TaxID=1689985 RepID=A0A845B5T1_9SPHN|nr:class I SAM-dependent methyltransferase [Allopontixanthobacter sediminis]MXP42999.1 methyltransferase domain-containing protein [Allopontixanthobacter sediminis]